MNKFVKRSLLLLGLSCLVVGPALTQTETFSTYIIGLAPVGTVNGTEKMFALQVSTPSTITPYQILNKVSGDCTMASPPSIVCTKTNGASFVASATTDTTNAANISSGTLPLARLALPSAFDYVGNGSNVPVGVAMTGDCTRSNTGAITCTKTNGSNLVTSATTDTTNATNISSGTLAGARQSAVNLAASGNGGVTGVLPFTNHPTGSLDTVLGYWGTTTQSATSVPNCTVGALQYSTTTHGWTCNVGAGSGNVSTSGTPVANQLAQWVSGVAVKGADVSTLPLIATIKVQTFTVSGTYTPSAGLQYAIIKCLAGGGGGGSTPNPAAGISISGGGGSAGSYSEALASAAAIGASKPVTIGALGVGGGSGGGDGQAGGGTSVGALCTTNGGNGGSQSGTATPGNPGPSSTAGTGNIVAAPGAYGGYGWYTGQGGAASGGGGNSPYGAGGRPQVIVGTSNLSGNNATGFGAGGGGGISGNGAGLNLGGSGTPGYVVILEFTNQ